MKRNTNFKKASRNLLGAFAVAALAVSCTDLEIEPTDSFFVDANLAGFQGITEPDSFIDGLYGQLGQLGDQANLFALNEVTTDAALIPTRGADWGDNGLWRQLHQHDWRPSHAFIETVWQQYNTLHFGGAQVLSELTESTATQRANAHFLQAFGQWVILDLFAQVPVRDPAADVLLDPEVLTGAEAVSSIVSSLEIAIADLPAGGPSAGNNRATKAAARYLLAKVLLNKHVYEDTEPAGADMNRVISLVDEIESDGFALQEGYFDIFRDTVDNETILWVNFGVGNRIWNGLHYNQTSARDNTGGGWNGFATLASYYDLFEGDPNENPVGGDQEERRGFVPTEGTPIGQLPGGTDNDGNGLADASHIGLGFLIGQQYGSTGNALTDRGGSPLIYKREFLDGDGNENLINNDETTGVRMLKYDPRYGSFNSHQILFRFSDAHLMQAEAVFRSGGDATTLINELRVVRGATPLGSVDAQDILDERGRELYAETWRRNDLIRFGQFTDDWTLKFPAAVGDENRNLFPIPASQIILNPNLTQNPGY